MTEEEAARIRVFHRMASDVLATAQGLCHRASEAMDGSQGAVLFHDLARALGELDDHPAMKAVRWAGISPALKAKHGVADKKGGE
jgi:hypothetical protein